MSTNGSSYIDTIQPKSEALSLKSMLRTNSNSGGFREYAGITYANQSKLPRLPIPTLEETLSKLPSRLEAILDEKEFEQTKLEIHEFLKGDGPILQEKLIAYENDGFENETIGSYVEEFWNESYLRPDVSSVLNLNPFFILEEGPDPKIAKDQLRRASSLCFAAVKFASALGHETLPPDVIKGQPLCMDQFKVLFGSSRQPVVRVDDTNQDDVHVYSDSSHVVVLYKNQFYYFPVLWPETGNVAVDEADIYDILKAIEKHADANFSEEEASRTALGVLTSLPRSEWAVARRELCKSSEANRMALKVIDSALFVLVLDDYIPETIHAAAANALHGTNKLQNTLQVGSCLNRWYDKLQIIVCKDGTTNVNFEHSTIDGHTALRLVSDVFAETVISFADSIVNLIHGHGRIPHVINATVHRVANCGEAGFDVLPKKLVFDFPASTIDRIYYAESALCDSVVASDTFVLEFADYGKKTIVSNSMSPDAFVQMSILLAYYKLYGKVVCMYEPAMTKGFYHGRTEAIRGATVQAKAFCKIFCNNKVTNDDKVAALKKATAEHSRLTRESSNGKGVDRHLFALKCLASRAGMPTPKFFEGVGWKKLNHTVLSTSNCGNPSLRFFGFGPVVPDGYGIGYIIKDRGISYSVSSKHRQTSRFVESLRNALNEMGALLTQQVSMTIDPTVRVPLSSSKMSSSNLRKIAEEYKFESYGDMFGLQSAALPAAPEKVDAGISRSKMFASVTTRSDKSVDLLALSDIKIDVDLKDVSETKSD